VAVAVQGAGALLAAAAEYGVDSTLYTLAAATRAAVFTPAGNSTSTSCLDTVGWLAGGSRGIRGGLPSRLLAAVAVWRVLSAGLLAAAAVLGLTLPG